MIGFLVMRRPFAAAVHSGFHSGSLLRVQLRVTIREHMARARRLSHSETSGSTLPVVATEPLADSNPEALELTLRLPLLVATCRNLLMRQVRRTVERWDLTLPQFDVLAELSRAGDEGFTFVELSRLLLVTSGNLTGIVDRLERDELVCRELDGHDRRRVRVALTNKGRQLVDEIMPLHARDIQALLSFMPVPQLTRLNDMLCSLREGLRSRPAADGGVAVVAYDPRDAVIRSRTRRRPDVSRHLASARWAVE